MAEPTTIASAQFTTDGMPAGEAWGTWQDLIAPLYELEPADDLDSFRGAVEVFDLRTMILSKITSSGAPQTGRRSGQLIRRSGLDHYVIEVCLSGDRHACDSRNGHVGFNAHSVVVLDLGQPMTSTAANFDSVSLTIPREVLDRHCRGVERLHGTSIADQGRSRLLREHVLSLLRHVPTMTVAEAALVGEASAALVGACLAPPSERFVHAGEVLDRTLLDRAIRHIDSRIGDPKLSAAGICTAVGTSRSNLYRLFEASGGVAHYIQERRLRGVHAALRNPAERRSISELAYACGFASASHFSRAFRELFGCSPSDVRDLKRGSSAIPKAESSQALINSRLKALAYSG